MNIDKFLIEVEKRMVSINKKEEKLSFGNKQTKTDALILYILECIDDGQFCGKIFIKIEDNKVWSPLVEIEPKLQRRYLDES